MRNAVFVSPESSIAGRNDQSSENITCAEERKLLAGFLLLIINAKSRLDVDLPRSCIYDEIYLMLPQLAPSVFDMLNLYDSDINIAASPHKLAEYRILHEMSLFLLSEAKLRIANAEVFGVVFCRVVKIAPAAYVIPLRFIVILFLSFMVLRLS